MIKFDDWLKLNSEGRKNKYEELSNEDKFKVRMGDYYDEDIETEIDKTTDFMQDINELYQKYKKENNIYS